MPQIRSATLSPQWLALRSKFYNSDQTVFFQLITIMFTSIDYLMQKATFKNVNPSIPITQEIPDSEDPAVFESALD